MIDTIQAVHGKIGRRFGNPGVGREYPALGAVAFVVLFLLGDGAHALLPSPAVLER